MKYQVNHNEVTHSISIENDEKTIELNGKIYNYDLQILHNKTLALRLGDTSYTIANVHVENGEVSFSLNGHFFNFPVKDEQQILLAEMGFKDMASSNEGKLNAPMPGKILEILVSEGDQVSQGTPLVILEAMKMENELKAPVDGVIGSITVETGQSVEKNTLLIEIEALG